MYIIIKELSGGETLYRTDSFGSTSNCPEHAKSYKSYENAKKVIADNDLFDFFVAPTAELAKIINDVNVLSEL